MASLYEEAKKARERRKQRKRDEVTAPQVSPQVMRKLLEKAWRGPVFHPSHLCRFRVMPAARSPEATRGQKPPVRAADDPETGLALWALARPLRGGVYIQHPSVAWLKRLWKRNHKYGC